VFHADAELAGRAFRLLREHAAGDTIRQAEKLRAAAPYYYNEAEYLGKYDNPQIDLFDFLLAYKMCHWHRDGGGRTQYFLTAHQTLNLAHYPYARLSSGLATLDFVRHLALPTHKDFDLAGSFEFLMPLPLETVFIENTRLHDGFPILLFDLPRLRTLSIKRGAYRARHPLPVPEGGPYGSPSLEKIVIEGYPIVGENRLGPFPALREAVLPRCGLTGLELLRESVRLEHLNLRSNYLEALPDFLSRFTRLKTLDLTQNPLRRIELDLGAMEQLEVLEIKVERKI
jgi:hypothetical protein